MIVATHADKEIFETGFMIRNFAVEGREDLGQDEKHVDRGGVGDDNGKLTKRVISNIERG